MDREKILLHFDQENERQTAGTVLDRIDQVQRTDRPLATDFFDPYQQRTADKVLHFFKDLKLITWGGYPGAERARILIFPSEKQATTSDVPLSFVQAETDTKTDGITHRDFLGSLLGLGLRREKVGDIVLLEGGAAQIVLHPDVLSFVLTHWQQVGKYKVSIQEVTTGEISPPAGRTREIKTTVASLRLDAVASSGFGMSRSKLTPAIRAGHVKLNWQSVKSASASVNEGDIISVAGRGRVEVAQVLGQSKKGRIQLLLKKHV